MRLYGRHWLELIYGRGFLMIHRVTFIPHKYGIVRKVAEKNQMKMV
jgi:hypothetical protein